MKKLISILLAVIITPLMLIYVSFGIAFEMSLDAVRVNIYSEKENYKRVGKQNEKTT